MAELETLADDILALLEDRLDPEIEADSLFDIDLESERAVAVEVTRLRRVLAELDPDPTMTAADAGPTDGGLEPAPTSALSEADGGASAGGAAAMPTREVEPYPVADPELLAARLTVDRYRLRFYELGKDGRDALVAKHQARQADAKQQDDDAKLTDAERRQRKAAAARQQALDAARTAHTEAERRVAEERARLLGIQEQQAALDAALIADKRQMDTFAESVLGWLRKADQVLEAEREARPEVARIDRIYDELVEHLGATRKGFAEAIATVDSVEGTPEPVGADPLLELPVEIDRQSLVELRKKLGDTERELLTRRESLRWKRMRQLHKAVRSLDERRRGLVRLLSDDKRDETLGFGPEGFEQARGEAEQVRLVLLYHTYETRRWAKRLGSGEGAGGAAVVLIATAVKWLLPLILFVWWRRRADRTLDRWQRAARERASRSDRPRSSRALEWGVGFVRRIRVPLEWLLLFVTILALLPKGASELLEVELAWTVLTWTLGGMLAVHTLDALFARRRSNGGLAVDVGKLRLRTLVMVGRVMVLVGLVLSLTAELVGRGTIYDWVFTTCWWAAAPIGLVVVHWWRPVIFHHVDRQRKEDLFLGWLDRVRDGWGSFFAAAGGGLYLLATAAVGRLRRYLGGLEWVRRGLALWFRHEVGRKTDGTAADADAEPVEPDLFDALGPEHPPAQVIGDETDAVLTELLRRIEQPGGAVVAVVGERGSGKSTLLELVRLGAPDTLQVQCTPNGIEGFQTALRAALDLPASAKGDSVRERLNDSRTGTDALLVDDAHFLVRPVVDGLEEVDRLIALARAASARTTWVFAFDRVIWQFFQRAREVRPLFDEVVELRPWSEPAIVRLIESRCRALDLQLDFSRLVTDLGDNPGTVAREQALERARTGYHRILWDYSRGNPAVALHFLRSSLAREPGGKLVVKLPRSPRASDSAGLPESTLFVLRAVAQLDEAAPATIAEATMLEEAQVADSLRYAKTRGWVVEADGRYSLPWEWFRAVTRFLERRHLLTGSHR